MAMVVALPMFAFVALTELALGIVSNVAVPLILPDLREFVPVKTHEHDKERAKVPSAACVTSPVHVAKVHDTLFLVSM